MNCRKELSTDFLDSNLNKTYMKKEYKNHKKDLLFEMEVSKIPATNGIVAQIFGTKYLSTLFGIVFLCHQFGAFAGAFLGGYFFDKYGSYDYAWFMAIALSIFATLVHYPIDETRVVRVDNTL